MNNEYRMKMEIDSKINVNICSICLELMNSEQINYTELSCKHSFHTECIVTWLSMGNRICPLCKQTVNREEELDLLPPPIIEIEQNNNIIQKNPVLEHIMLCIMTLTLIFYLVHLQMLRRNDLKVD